MTYVLSEVKSGGPSGCGKTTLMKVMLGLLKPEAGQVLVDGIDAEKLGKRNYRSQIAAVMQDDQLLSGSIADNICFFDPQFPDFTTFGSPKSPDPAWLLILILKQLCSA